ncbi:hypothetical protein MCOR04_010886 [Pyricularia oryzae]|nr:hypothetical protein MCOR04_010886 [Pyricularia oryzae]
MLGMPQIFPFGQAGPQIAPQKYQPYRMPPVLRHDQKRAGPVNHLESGTCPNTQNLSRDAFYRLVRSRDAQGVISKKLIGWTGEAEYKATVHTWNGSGYECYLCHSVFQEI